MLHSHLPRSQHRLLGQRVTLTFSGITGVLYGYDTEFEPLLDITGRRFNRFAGSSDGSAPTLSMLSLLSQLLVSEIELWRRHETHLGEPGAVGSVGLRTVVGIHGRCAFGSILDSVPDLERPSADMLARSVVGWNGTGAATDIDATDDSAGART